MNMDLAFNWETDRAAHRARAQIVPSGDKAIELIANLLTDDGGLGTEHSISWIRVGIERLQSVSLGQVEIADWTKETFGVCCDRARAKLYFLPDEEYWVEIHPLALMTLLTVWRDFLLAGPTDANGEINSTIIPLGDRDQLLLDENVW